APPVAAAAPAPPAAAALGVPRRREAAEAVAPRRARLACPPAGRERAGAPRALPRLAGGRGAAAGCAEGRGGREAVRAEGCAVQHGARSAFARGERIHTRALAVGFRGALPQMRGRTGSRSARGLRGEALRVRGLAAAPGARPARPQIRMCVFRPRRFSGVGGNHRGGREGGTSVKRGASARSSLDVCAPGGASGAAPPPWAARSARQRLGGPAAIQEIGAGLRK
ncbi:unnamed protein product, partial [Prorocentrum cordatum]